MSQRTRRRPGPLVCRPRQMLHFMTPMPKPTRPTEFRRGKGVGEMIAVELTGDPREIPEVRAAIRALADRHGFASRASDLVLALDELVANGREHGKPRSPFTRGMTGDWS